MPKEGTHSRERIRTKVYTENQINNHTTHNNDRKCPNSDKTNRQDMKEDIQINRSYFIVYEERSMIKFCLL